MLHLDPSRRITAQAALMHPYLTSAPLPCKPHEMPQFEGEHKELQTRQNRFAALKKAPDPNNKDYSAKMQ